MSGEKKTFKLSSPISAHGKEISEICLRPVRAGDVMECGYPVLALEGGESTRVDPQAVGRLISKLGDIPLSSVKSMSIEDFNGCAAVMMSFFTPSAAEIS
jgi:hypothetical protein